MPIGATPPQSGSSAPPGSAVVDGPTLPFAPAAKIALAKWLAMIARNDFRDLPSLIAADAVYHSPVEWHPYPGRDLVCLLVRTAAGILEDFKYQRQFASGENAVLEFSAHVGGEKLKAVHIIRFNVAGEIVDIDLMARPAKGEIGRASCRERV